MPINCEIPRRCRSRTGERLCLDAFALGAQTCPLDVANNLVINSDANNLTQAASALNEATEIAKPKAIGGKGPIFVTCQKPAEQLVSSLDSTTRKVVAKAGINPGILVIEEAEEE